MTFVTLEDETGHINIIVWRDLAEKQRRELLTSRLLTVDGILEKGVVSAERIQHLIIGGAHPYERPLPPSSRLDGSDPKAFVETLLRGLGVDFAALPTEKQAEFFDNDFLALAAAHGDRPSLEEILPTLTMPCLLYVGEADGNLPRMQQCVQ